MRDCFLTNKPITDNPTRYDRYKLGPSSFQGCARVFTQDEKQVVSVDPNGNQHLVGADQDTSHEAFFLIDVPSGVGRGSGAFYYDQLEVGAQVHDVITTN